METLHIQLAASGAAATADSFAILVALDRKRCTQRLKAEGFPVPGIADRFIRQRFAEPVTPHRSSLTASTPRSRSLAPAAGSNCAIPCARHFYREVNSYGDGIRAGTIRDLLARDDETFAVADLPTAYLNNAQHRFRFAVIDGHVTHAAGRLAETYLAREYYGGRRREIDAYHQRFGAGAWQHLITVAEQAAAAFPGLRTVGVDIAASQVGGPDVVYDIDPFGARLPAALGLPGTPGEGLHVPSMTLRAWAAR